MKARHKQTKEDTALLQELVSSVKLNELMSSTQFRLRLMFKLLIFLCAVMGLYSLLFNVMTEGMFVFVFTLFGIVQLLFAFNFAHDLSHDTVFKNRRLNRIGFVIIYTLNGAHAASWRERHLNSHHFAPNVEGHDTDMKISSLIRVIPGSPYRFWHKFQHLYAPLAYSTYSLFWVFIKDFTVYFSDIHKKKIWYHLSFFFQKSAYLTYILLIPLLFAPQQPVIIFTGFMIMHLVQSLFLLFTFFITHHVEGMYYPGVKEDGTIECSWVMNQLLSSNDIYPFSKTANFIFGGFNNHTAHHLFPNVHHLYYPALSRQLYQQLGERGIVPHQTGYFEGIISHLRLLRKMGAAPSYSKKRRKAILSASSS